MKTAESAENRISRNLPDSTKKAADFTVLATTQLPAAGMQEIHHGALFQ